MNNLNTNDEVGQLLLENLKIVVSFRLTKQQTMPWPYSSYNIITLPGSHQDRIRWGSVDFVDLPELSQTAASIFLLLKATFDGIIHAGRHEE